MGQWLSEDEERSLIAFRRTLHAHPELSWDEWETSKRIQEQLESMGLSVHTGIAQTGLYADIGDEGPLVILRADMDALPIHEEADVPFRSTKPGVMHACGHDAHSACLVAAARRLIQNPPPKGRVRLLFQPAEELGAGAPQMIREGVLDDPQLIGIYGLHFWSQLPTGGVYIVPDSMMGSVDQFEITVHGQGGHGAAPHRCRDPLVAAAYLVTTLQTAVSRRVDPLHPAVVTVGQFVSGSAFNIIPEQAKLVGTIRTMDRSTWLSMPQWLDEITHGTVGALGCTAQVQLRRAQLPLVNDPDAAQLAFSVAEQLVGSEKIGEFRTLAGEDFAAYLEQTKGCFFFVGAGGPSEEQATHQPAHHNPKFILDEDAFPLGTRLLEECARKALYELNSTH